DYILLLNNDTLVDPGLVDHLVDVISKTPEIGVVGPKIYYASPRDQIWFAGGEVHLSRGTARHIGIREKDNGQHDTVKDVDYVTGCALMARREVFEHVGLLDPTFQAYYEDADFCMRARRGGYRVVYVPDGRVWHRISSSTGGQLSANKVSRKLKSTWVFFRRYASPHHWLTVPFFFAADVARILFLVSTGRIRDTGRTEQTAGRSEKQA
ncbi:MAG: glycosyltransferase family 2 protein, partial [Candidatus Latescibacterota bacterium]